MIVKPTVFVLGAGASAPYGFPTGATLAGRVCESLKVVGPDGQFGHSDLSRAILETFKDHAISIHLIQAFAPTFRDAGCDSLDEFVEAQGNRRFLPLVKAAIITTLVGHEHDDRLYPDNKKPQADAPNKDWCKYLFRYMRTDDEKTFEKNLVKVITFNFDRSFERQLFLMIRAAYGVPDEVAATLRRAIPVLHLHGSLGDERWIGESGPDARDYAPEATAEQKVALFDNIRIIHEEIPKETLDKAHDWLMGAHTICFLGFGFHPINMGRLRLNEPYPNGTICGTALGLSGAEEMRVRNFLSNKPHQTFAQSPAYSFLRDTRVLQTEYD